MNARKLCNMSGSLLNGKGTNNLIKNISFCSNRFCSNCLVSKVNENFKKSAQFELKKYK